jgi:hypothetical protein
LLWRRGFILIALALTYFGLSPTAQALLPAPPPDGGYPNGNTAEGTGALFSLTTGTNNTAIGSQALFHETTGSNNAAAGFRALYSNTVGVNNTAAGSQALSSNTTGGQNTANGYVALSRNTSGGSNTATGSGALHSNTSASHNTATGYIALYNNTTGTQNTATGDRALYSNTTGTQNTANGYQALNSNTADGNTATGFAALYHNTTGAQNTANGNLALYSNATGYYNTAVGYQALQANTSGYFNIAIGIGAGGNLTGGSGNIDIGNSGTDGESNTIRIGVLQTATFIAGIYGATASGGTAVYINSSGQLGTATSSARFKQDIHSMDKASEMVLALRPLTFRYKPKLDPNGIPQFGLVAEEVEKVNPDLVVRDADGKPYTVRYEAVNAMLLNEFLKEHRKVEDLQSAVAKQEATAVLQEKQIRTLTASLKEQASQIQKVSARLDVIKPAPQMVLNSQ